MAPDRRMASAEPLANRPARNSVLSPINSPGTPASEPAHDAREPVARYLTVKGLAQAYRDVTTESALRHLIWLAEAYEKYPKNGLASNGFLRVIVRPPHQRKVLLDRIEFENWLTSRQVK